MTPSMQFAVGTLLTWAGWIFVARAVILWLQLLFNAPGVDRDTVQRGALLCTLTGVVLLGLTIAIPMTHKDAVEGMRIPLVWFVMPVFAWGAVLSVIMIVMRLIQAWLAMSQKERLDRIIAAGTWLVAGIIFVYLFRRDPGNKIDILSGSIPLSITFVVVAVLLLLLGASAMIVAGRWAAGRGLAQTIVSQTALVAGSLLFGLPFAFLVMTSFKEDRDMSSPEGIVWIPRVQETVPFMDPKNPFYETQRDGQRVTGSVLERLADGKVRVEIEEPRAIRGTTFETTEAQLKEIPKKKKLVTANLEGTAIKGMVIEDLEDGGQRVHVLEPASLKGSEHRFGPGKTEPIRHVGLRTENYSEALSFLPPETNNGLVYVKNTLLLVILSIIGTILSSSIVAYAFSRMKFPGRDVLFMILLSTMMLPAAVTMLPQFLIFRSFGWIDTLYPLWVPAFFASAFNVFLLRQFFKQIPMELEDAAKIDGASYPRTFWSVMLPQIKPALAVIAIWTFMGAWNNFMGPLIYINSPENMPLSYALQLFQGDRGGEPGLLMAFATMTIIPVLLVFFFAQRYFIEGVTLSGLGGR